MVLPGLSPVRLWMFFWCFCMQVDPQVPKRRLPRPWIWFAAEDAVSKREGSRGWTGGLAKGFLGCSNTVSTTPATSSVRREKPRESDETRQQEVEEVQ
jgi:hypothetical protein